MRGAGVTGSRQGRALVKVGLGSASCACPAGGRFLSAFPTSTSIHGRDFALGVDIGIICLFVCFRVVCFGFMNVKKSTFFRPGLTRSGSEPRADWAFSGQRTGL